MLVQLMEAKVSYVKINERGKQKRVTEKYLVNAMSCTECEKLMNEELSIYKQKSSQFLRLDEQTSKNFWEIRTRRTKSSLK